MVWLMVLVPPAVIIGWLSARQRRREWEDLTRPGMPARRTQPRRGVGGLGEAPPTVHHRLGGPSSRD